MIRTAHVSTGLFCQVRNAKNKNAFRRPSFDWKGALRYFFMPEDSSVTVFRADSSPNIVQMSARLGQLKMGLWVTIALAVAALIAQLQ